MIFDQQLERVRPGVRVSRAGAVEPDWSPGAVDRLLVEQVSVQPATQTEQADETRTKVVTGLRVYGAEGVDIDIRAGDRVEYDGLTYDVDGDIARWPHPLDPTSVHHVEWAMTRTRG